MQEKKSQPITGPLRIKPEYVGTVIGFNNCSLPMGKRTDLDKIYEFAKNRPYPKWLAMFEPVTVDQDKTMEQEKIDRFLERHPVKAEPVSQAISKMQEPGTDKLQEPEERKTTPRRRRGRAS